jgi:hypothetical protein
MSEPARIVRPPKVEFDPTLHQYRVGGIVKPSVTQILGSVGARVEIECDDGKFKMWKSFFDYSFLSDYDADIAKARGSWVADLIAYELKKQVSGRWSPLTEGLSRRQRERLSQSECYPDIIGEAWLPYYDCFERWYTGRRDLKTIFVEKPLYDPSLDCCGSPDWFGTMDGKYTIIDWKTGMASPDTRYQTAAYKALIEAQHDLQKASNDPHKNFIHRAALELHNDGTDAKLIMYPIQDAANDRGVFLAARRIYQAIGEGLR